MVKTPRSPVTTGLVLNYLVYLFWTASMFILLMFKCMAWFCSHNVEEYAVICMVLFSVDYPSTFMEVQNAPFIAKPGICYTCCAKVWKTFWFHPRSWQWFCICSISLGSIYQGVLFTFFNFCLCIVVAVAMKYVEVAVSLKISLFRLPYLTQLDVATMAILGASGGNDKLWSVILIVAMVSTAIIGGDGATCTSHEVAFASWHIWSLAWWFSQIVY